MSRAPAHEDRTERLLSDVEAAAILGRSPRWLKAQARARQVPHRRVGRYYKFTRSDVEAIIRQFAQPTARELVAADRRTRRSA